MTNWQEVKLGEICTIIDGDRGKNYPKSNELQPQGYCLFLNTKNVPDNKFNFSECTFISKDKDELLGKGKLNYGDIVVTTRGTLANFAYYTKKCIYNKIRINSGMVILRNENKDLCTHYLYHFLISNNFKQQVQSLATGSAQPQLPIKDMKNIIMNLPPIDIQKKIAGVLGVLDDKIELNNKINNNLEQQAQSLFKSWFVDFEPFGGTMPDDWKVGNLLDIADYLNGLAMQKFRPAENDKGLPVLKIKELRQGFCDSNSELCSLNVKNEYIVNDGDVIFSWSGSLLVDFWCGGKCGLNQHLFKVTSKNFDKWFYFLWTKHYLEHFAFIAADKATTMGHIKREELEKAKVIIPSSECYQKMKQIMTPIYDLLISNRVENTRLSALRDTLLPKLMSGEIDVSNVDISALISTDKLSFTE